MLSQLSYPPIGGTSEACREKFIVSELIVPEIVGAGATTTTTNPSSRILDTSAAAASLQQPVDRGGRVGRVRVLDGFGG